MESAFTPVHSSFVRLNYYPICHQAPSRGQLGINCHPDSGALTVLYQDGQEGLQVFI
ncbi:MAG: hypothetical protein GXP16_12700 [Gammaproteobacteria bacterium]|nr:hypothetical protein [Gammaproteobacteria bacterium]